MKTKHAALRGVPRIALILSAIVPESLEAQDRSSMRAVKDTVARAHEQYDAGSLHRTLFGDNYRDLWAMPIRVPVLDLTSFGGGLRPWKTGGGRATKTLRLLGPDSAQYVFRPVYKNLVDLPREFRHTIIWDLVVDQRSALHPLAPLASPPPLAATRIPHPTPLVVMMPDDAALGEFRKDFGGVLGTIEEFPDVPEKGFAFGGAEKIINGDALLTRINKDPADQIDARAFLTAHLVDLLLGDADRHADQWKWARFQKDGQWIPIPRDRDMVFVSYEGLLPKVAGMISPALVSFDSAYAPPSALFHNAIEHDRRLLSGLEKPVWDSIAASVVAAVTDSVLAALVGRMPREYAASSAQILAKLKARRDHLPETAARYYQFLATVVDLHATDTADRATVVRTGEGLVDIRIQSGNSRPYFQRRFDARETQEIRLYLHDGNDSALVTGRVQSSIPVRIIGGNGDNVLVDSSSVGGRRNPTHLYDQGHVSGVIYEPDSIIELKAELDEGELPFNRRPWPRLYGKVRQPQRDRGSTIKPVVGLRSGHGLGVVPRIGVAQTKYGFGMVPYSSMMKAEVAWSTTNRFEIEIEGDKRFESSGLHTPIFARMSQLDVVEFRGLGNDVPDSGSTFDDVRQRTWSFQPAIGFSFGPKSDVSVGPVVRYTTTDSVPNRFISVNRPYGFQKFGETGIRFELRHDTRNHMDTARTRGGFAFNPPDHPPLWGKLKFTASAYAGMWDVSSPYQDISGVGAAYLTLPFLTHPLLAVRAGGQKLFGEFPYFDAAFLGGSGSLRTEHRQRWAGDAAIYGTSELRVPVAKFPLILPLNVGLLGFIDVGRVYVEDESPGGWHKGMGGGLWISVIRPDAGINITVTNNPDRRVITHLGFTF
jgi:hypothetical protein